MSEVQQCPRRIPMHPKLHQAARSGDKTILDELLGPEEVSSTASMEAVSIRVPEDAATQIDTRVDLLGVTLEGNTALHIVASLEHLEHLELAKEICQREISLLAAINTMLDTPLHCAAKAGNDKMVSLLIQFAGEDGTEARRVLRARNRDGSNALHEAAKYAHARVAEVLMEKDSGLASMLNDAGMSPLYLAIVTGSFDVAEVLLRHPSTEMASPTFYAGPDDRTALHEAVLLDPGNRAIN